MSGSILDWISNLFSGGSMGGTPSVQPDYQNIAPPAQGANAWDISGGATPSDIAASSRNLNIAEPSVTNADVTGANTWNTNVGGAAAGTGQPASQKIADALNKLSQTSATKSNQAPQQANLGLRSPQVSSQLSRGQNQLGTLAQLLLQRAAQYGPPSYGSTSSRGLLG